MLINADGHAKITDFGLSKMRTLSVATAEQCSQSLAWMAPEVRDLNPRYSEASDLYSFGIIVWEIITGQTPSVGQSPGKIPTHFPKVYQDLIEGCCSKNPNDRPDLAAVLATIEAYDPCPASPNGEAYFEKAKRYEQDKAYERAYTAYDKAASKGVWKAHTACALFTLQGGLGNAPVDKQSAKQRLTIAAEHGHQRAMYNVARMHEKGDGIAENSEQALYWYQKASEFDASLLLTKDAQAKVDQLKSILLATVRPSR